MPTLSNRFSLIFLLIASFPAWSQNPYEYFDKDDGSATAENCYYYRISQSDTVKTFFCSTKGLRSVEVGDDRTRVELFYYENTQLRTKVDYINYFPSGIVKTWYSDGKIQSEELHNHIDRTSALLNYWDSLGTQLIANGTGNCKCVFNAYKMETLVEEGKLINGKRDSLWNGFREDRSKYFEEWYKNGELVSGISFDKEGIKYEYTVQEETASPSGGMPGFYSLVGQNIKYPKSARRLGIEGRVFIQFIVEKDGSLSDIKCIKGIGGGCDEEAERVISLSKKWTPGKQRGKIVKQKMVLPIMFKLT
jgi:TonB family protein